MSDTTEFSPIRWQDDTLLLLDQTRLPVEETWLHCTEVDQVCGAIRRLSVRGAPAIGVTAAYGLALSVRRLGPESFDDAHDRLASTRPTAVNLRWALEQGASLQKETPPLALGETLLAWAHRLHEEDIDSNRRIGEWGSPLFGAADRVLTHCNTGALATAGIGTALGVIRTAYRDRGLARVWVDETRPLLQGARLTTWELERLGIPYRLVTDNSAGALMSRGLVDRVVVGADRIAGNGDVANKIGTYSVAVLAHHHEVPFYVAAPRSTIDRRTPTGADIPIEERQSEEVTTVFGTEIAPAGCPAQNYAFDVTPHRLVAGIITEVGVLRAPYERTIAEAFRE